MNVVPVVIVMLVIAIFAATFSDPTYTGNVVRGQNTEYLLNNLDEVKDSYNANIENVPGFFKSLFGNEIIKLNIDMGNEEEVLYIKTRKGRIVHFADHNGNHTLEVWTDSSTIDHVSTAEDQVRAISAALKEGDIRYEAVNFKTKVKTKVMGVSYKVWNIFN